MQISSAPLIKQEVNLNNTSVSDEIVSARANNVKAEKFELGLLSGENCSNTHLPKQI